MTPRNARALAAWAPAAAALLLAGTAGGQAVPTDADPATGCPISPSTVAGMFQTNTVTLNGVAKAADSTQVLQPDCGFFQWSEQMFLWMTSPAPPSYGGGSRIMFSPKFMTVTPEGATGRRTFIPNSPGFPLQMVLRKTELGPHGLPAMLARTGQVIEVQRPVPGRPVPPVVRLPSGAKVRLGYAERGPKGTLRLFDLKGAEVHPARLTLPKIVRARVELRPGEFTHVVPVSAFQQSLVVQKAIVNHIPIFIDPQGNVIDVEVGQAGFTPEDGVLLSQNGSLIYYITVVNDLFAYHRSMHGAAVIPVNTSIQFPMTTADANAVVAFAAGKGHTILEPQALAVESKSSWIDASAVPNPGDYIQATATVPTFNKSNPNNWVPNGQQTINVVMVGLHVVGSTNEHGEMVWATFEHVGNTPNATYTYTSTSGPKSVLQSTGGAWIFSPTGWMGQVNSPAAKWTGSAIAGTPVSSSPVLRTKPWGTDGSNAHINTEIISANRSVISQLVPGDVRRNYFQVGATWSFGAGSDQLNNSTIETFVQAPTPAGSGASCFDCHSASSVAISHVYRQLKPLP